MTECPHRRLPLVAEACSDDASVLALSIARFVASGYMTGDVACWDAAYAGAERVLGAEQAASLVGALTGLMRALRAERAGEWSFMPATCCRLTPDEQDLVALLDGARRLGPGPVEAAAARLAGARAPRLAAAALQAGGMLERIKGAIPVAPSGPARPAGAALH